MSFLSFLGHSLASENRLLARAVRARAVERIPADPDEQTVHGWDPPQQDSPATHRRFARHTREGVHRLLEDRETILADLPTTNRRSFLAHGLRLLLAGPVAAGSLRTAAAAATRSEDPTAGLTPVQWKLVAAVQQQLLPSEPGIPGAREVNAVGFLRLVMADPRFDASERKFIEGGVVELEQVCGSRYSKSFLELTDREQGAALRQLEQSHSGHGWLAEMLEFLMEALLGDPSHGGNPAGVGWKWLGITPGFPRPPVA